jgi:ABC-type protease/lipase transport system fused ATPase/permease subunit
LPQTVELFDGTLAENVARFGQVNVDEVRRVIDLVGLTDMVRQLPEGLNTRIGEEGSILSGGQRQRVALARAIYAKPKLIVLDEPNSNLDDAGEKALLETLANLKAQGASVLVITHRTSILPQADKLLMLREGQVVMFGPRDQVLEALQKANEEATSQAKTAQLAQSKVQPPSAQVVEQRPSNEASVAQASTVQAPPTRTFTVPAGRPMVAPVSPQRPSNPDAKKEGENS